VRRKDPIENINTELGGQKEMDSTVGEWISEARSFVISVILAICAGWSSKLAALLTDPIYSTIEKIGWGSGWIAGLLVAFVITRQMLEDYEFYVAMGIFAIPAIATFLLSWENATWLFGLSLAGLLIVGGKEAYRLVKKALPF